MSFQILPNLIFLFAVLGIIILILRRVPEATGSGPIPGLHTDPEEERAADDLRRKGVPAAAWSKTQKLVVAVGKRIWRFILEAKGLSQNPKVSYKINKLLKNSEQAEDKTEGQTVSETTSHSETQSAVAVGQTDSSVVTPSTTENSSAAKTNEPANASGPDENYYIDLIKRFPKDWQNYNNLGQFYLDNKNHQDAQGVYEFLTKQDSQNSEFWAKLGYTKFCLGQFGAAVSNYVKSVELDQSHPNRYYNLGLAHLELNHKAEAKLALQKAIQLEPDNVKYKEALSEAENPDAK